MALVFALGNPGERYTRTRHNVGWWVADELRRRHRATPVEATREYRAWRATVEERELDIVLPLMFMNASGDALAAWRDRHGLEVDALLVVSDDVYLPVGHVRLRPNGSSGGHRGLESIEVALGSREYARLRIGVGAVESEQLREHVLETFEGDEERVMEDAVRTAADAVELWAHDGILAAMNRFNRRAKEASES